MDTMRWQHCLGLAAGAWLMSSSWALNALRPPLAPAVNGIVTVAALIVFGVVQILGLRARPRQALLLSAWAFLAILLLELTSGAVSLILVGFIALATAAWAILIEKEKRQRQRPRRNTSNS
jgi:xanthine/uracil/vitamin C permease (AzgA family)